MLLAISFERNNSFDFCRFVGCALCERRKEREQDDRGSVCGVGKSGIPEFG